MGQKCATIVDDTFVFCGVSIAYHILDQEFFINADLLAQISEALTNNEMKHPSTFELILCVLLASVIVSMAVIM